MLVDYLVGVYLEPGDIARELIIPQTERDLT